MRKYTVLLIILFIITLGVLSLGLGSGMVDRRQLSWVREIVPVKVKKPEFPERIGEKIIYDVKMGNIRLGRAEFEHLPRAELNGQMVNLISFKTKLFKFIDTEMIYSDAESFLPLRVIRDILAWPKKEQINEDYDQSHFRLTITKSVGKNKPETTIIQRAGPIQNAILLPYYVRRVAKLDPGWSFKANLPTQSFEIKLLNVEDVVVPAGTFKAYHFQSVPSRFDIWISADQRKIPLKIKGSGGIGYVLLMREYVFKEEASH